MSILRKCALAIALLGNAAFLATPSFAVEPDVDFRSWARASSAAYRSRFPEG